MVEIANALDAFMVQPVTSLRLCDLLLAVLVVHLVEIVPDLIHEVRTIFFKKKGGD